MPRFRAIAVVTLIAVCSSTYSWATCGHRETIRSSATCAVWHISTEPFPEAHFAVYPEELVATPIRAGCSPGGIVLDPFIGSGTTAVVMLKQHKRFVGIELNPKYVELVCRNQAVSRAADVPRSGRVRANFETVSQLVAIVI